MKQSAAITVLICDDKARMRDVYGRVLLKIPGVTVEKIDHPKRIVPILTSTPSIGCLMIDLEFPIDPEQPARKDIIGHRYLPEIRARFPSLKIVVVTQLGPAVYAAIRECGTKGLYDEWIDVGKEIKDDEIIARVEPLLYPLGVISKAGLWLVHLSDLHFGRSTPFKFWGRAEDGTLLEAIKADLKDSMPKEFAEFSRKADLVLVSGDLTNRARDREFEDVESFLQDLARECLARENYAHDDPISKILVIPGNHDVNLDISRARCIETGEDGELKDRKITREEDVAADLRYLRKYMWAPFERFCGRLPLAMPSTGSLWNKDAYYSGAVWRFPVLGATIIGVNTSADCVDHFTERPKVSADVVRKLDEDLRNTGEGEIALPRILVAHHSLGSVPTGAERANDDEIAHLRKACFKKLGTRVFLTGHVHEEITERIDVDGRSLLFVGAGSAGVEDDERPEREPLHYNLINLRPRGAADASPDRITVYSRVGFKDEFVAHPKRPKQAYHWDDTGGWVAE